MLKLTRLKQVPIKGNFTINCEDNLQFIMVQKFFCTSGEYIRFKNIHKILEFLCKKDTVLFPYIPLMVCGDKRTKFIIKYETLEELLKIREIFRVRSGRFDMELIKKRDYDPFTDDFYKLCENTNIEKVRK